MPALIQDFIFTLRLMRKRRGMTFLAIAALVLGIGLNVAVFSVINAVLLRPLPIYQPDRVVWLNTKVNQTGASLGTSYADFLDWRAQARSFESMAALYAVSFTMTGGGAPERLKTAAISASGFKTWGVNPILGHDFTETDDQSGSNRVAILSFAFWHRRFGGDSNVIAKKLVLDDQAYTIIGVLQDTPIGVLRYPDIWVTNGPLIDKHIMERDTRYFFPAARLKPNVSYAQARAEMDTIAGRLAEQYPDTTKGIGVKVTPLVDQYAPSGGKPLLLLIAASGALFLLAMVNLVTVFMANTVERTQELSVRLALGSTRSTLLRQLFIQALIFAGLGSALGLLLAKLGLTVFLHRFPDAVIRFQETTIDFHVVLATIGMALIVTVAATLPPAIYAFRLKISSEPKGAFALPKYRSMTRGGLILFEVTLASALTLVAGLLIKSFRQVQNIDLGFSPHQVFSFQVNLPATHYKDAAKQAAFYRLATAKLAQLPGMNSVSGISGLPLTTQANVNNIDLDTDSPLSGQHLLVEDESILPAFFRALHLPLLAGRDFTDDDHDGTAPVIIVDDALARKLWPGQIPIGKRVKISNQAGTMVRWLEVVGVVQEIKHFGPESKVRWMQVYVPLYQDPSTVLSFVFKTTMPEAAIKLPVDKALHELDKDLPVESFQAMDSYLDKYLSGRKASLLLLGSFAVIGVLLGMIGIYGVVANAVIRRQRELAIRMAIGATASRNTILITRMGLWATLGGIVLGSAIVAGMTRVLTSVLFGISAVEPGVYVLTAAVIIVLAIAASLIPALRLSRLNIQETLRQ